MFDDLFTNPRFGGLESKLNRDEARMRADRALTDTDKADAEIDRILAEQYERGMSLLTEHRGILDAIADRLIEKEKIDGVEMLELIKGINAQLVSDDAMAAVQELVRTTTTVVEGALDTISGDGDSPTPATAQ